MSPELIWAHLHDSRKFGLSDNKRSKPAYTEKLLFQMLHNTYNEYSPRLSDKHCRQRQLFRLCFPNPSFELAEMEG